MNPLARTAPTNNSDKVSSDLTRRTDRVQISIAIEAVGLDLARGRTFCQKGHTSMVSRHGAAIVLNYALASDQELTIRCLETNKEAEARVLGLLSGPGRDLVYGIAFLDAAANPWDIEFPTLTGNEGLGRILLQCRVCQGYEIFHLDEIEMQVFQTNQSIQKGCKTCSSATSWRRVEKDASSESSLPSNKQNTAPISQGPRVNRRKHSRIRSTVPACIRRSGLSEAIVTCENQSRGGFRFRTPKPYAKGARIEVAVPYTTGSGNIFVPARVVHVENRGGVFRIGVAYDGSLERQEGQEKQEKHQRYDYTECDSERFERNK